jgi:hypothetical protein
MVERCCCEKASGSEQAVACHALSQPRSDPFGKHQQIIQAVAYHGLRNVDTDVACRPIITAGSAAMYIDRPCIEWRRSDDASGCLERSRFHAPYLTTILMLQSRCVRGSFLMERLRSVA